MSNVEAAAIPQAPFDYPPQDEPEPEFYEPASPEPAPRRLGFLGPVPYDLPFPDLHQCQMSRAQLEEQDTPPSRFQRRNYLAGSHPKKTWLKNCESPENTNAGQNYTPIFLTHARMYTFAGMHLVGPLKKLALHKLHNTLIGFQLYDQRVGDVLALARYAYENGTNRGADGKLDGLRALVVEYMAGEVATLGKHADVVRMMEEGGEFVGDFWEMVATLGL